MLILSSFIALIKLRIVWSKSAILTIDTIIIREANVVSNVITFLTSFCFLFIIFINSLILILTSYWIAILLLILISRITISFLIIFIIILYRSSNLRVFASFKLILCFRIILVQISRNRLFKNQEALIYLFIWFIIKSFEKITLNWRLYLRISFEFFLSTSFKDFKNKQELIF